MGYIYSYICKAIKTKFAYKDKSLGHQVQLEGLISFHYCIYTFPGRQQIWDLDLVQEVSSKGGRRAFEVAMNTNKN